MPKIVSIASEALLIKEILSGQKEKFRIIYDRYHKDLFLVTLRYAEGRNQAQDLLQDSFMEIFKSLRTYDPKKSKFLTWSKRIAINTCLGNLRKKKIKFVSDSGLNGFDVSSKLMNPEQELSLKDMMEMIQQLPLGYKTIFNMYVIDGFSHEEIGKTLNISPGTSKSQLHKAKQKLKGIMSEKNLIFQYG